LLLRDNIYQALRTEILTCRLLPGQEVNELNLASQYSVSRAPVREALLRLQREHLVTVMPRQGYRVNPISVTDAQDLFDFRMVLEPACASAAASYASDKTLDELDRFRRFKGDFIEYNREFHCAVAEASGNRRMALAACDLIEQAERLVRVSIANVKERDPSALVAEHGALIDALQAREARLAARLAREHIGSACDRVVTALKRSAVVI
jgi:GntR family transcriptional regulator, rspAB operon transcriptional repressor